MKYPLTLLAVCMLLLASCIRNREYTVVSTVTHASDGTPLVRDEKGRFAKYYWYEGKLYVPEEISETNLKQALAEERQ